MKHLKCSFALCLAAILVLPTVPRVLADDRPGQGHIQAIRLDGAGDVTGTHRVWKRDDVGVFVSSLAEYPGRVYLLRPRGNIVCLDPAAGSMIWTGSLPRTNASYYASPVMMHERIIASPAVADGRLLLRGDEHLFCVEIGKR
jgi:outer membrane protein assembly factor BamB